MAAADGIASLRPVYAVAETGEANDPIVILVGPTRVVSGTVTEANSFKVFLSGQVRTPVVYRLRSETTILQIIPMAGGLTEWADQKKILVIRKEDGKDKRITVNYKKLVKDGDLSQNLVLKAGDTIIVP